jgi:hypothetical protein
VQRALITLMAMGLTACLGDGRPLDEYIAYEESRRLDAGPNGEGAGEVDVPPPVCSKGGAAVVLTFTNNSGRKIDVLWIDGSCNEVRYGTLEPGTTHNQPTYAEHAWRLRDTLTQAVLFDFLGATETGETEVVYP